MKKLYLVTLLILQLALATKTNAQNVGINATSSLPDNSAMLDVSSTDKGFLAPRLTTTQQNAISLPATGLLIFNTTDNVFKVNTGTPAVPLWTPLALGSGLSGTGYPKFTGSVPTYITAIPNTDLANSAITIQGTATSLGGTVNIINGTGFVKAAGTTISYDNNTYLTSTTGRTNISLTNTGSSGAATYNSSTGVLNVPTYTLAGLGGISLTALSGSGPLAYNSGTGAFSISQANTSTNGYLSSTDWTTFNNKQAALSGTANRITIASNIVDIAATYTGQNSITTLGTIGTGTWQGTAIGPTYGGTGQTTVATGDLLYGSAANSWSKLAAGSNGQVLTLTSGIPSWTTNPGATAWNLTGNTVTAGSQFLGSTNNVSLRMRTNNVERMVVDSVGNVGIGTNNPDYSLTINKSLNGQNGVNVVNTSTGTGAFANALLQLKNDAGFAGQVFKNNTGYGNYKAFTAGDFGLYNSGSGNISILNDYASGKILFTAGGASSAQMTLATSGNLGIGQSTPTAVLHIKAGTATANTAPLKFTSGTNLTTPEDGAVEYNGTHFYGTIGSTRYQLDQQATGTAWSLTGNAATSGSHFLGTTNNVSLRFRTNNTERMVIDSVGNVGLGVTNPGARFVLKDSMEIRRVGTVAQLLFTNTAGSGDFRIGGDGNDIYWQGGGGRSLQMGSYWATIIGGDRQSATLPAFVSGISGTATIIQSYRDASVSLGIQSNSVSQTANLTEWRNSAGTPLSVVDVTGDLGLGITTPTAVLHIKAGTASANTAPLKFTAGTNLATPENGAVEFNGTHFYGTVGSTRYQLDQQAAGGTTTVANGGTGQTAALTAGGVVYGASTTAMGVTSAGTSGQVLQSTGSGTPAWVNGGTMMLSGNTNNSTETTTSGGQKNYYPVTGTISSVSTSDVSAGTRTVMSRAGTIRNLYVVLDGAPGGGKNITVTIYKGGTAQTLTVAINGNVTVNGSDTTNSFTVAAGDEVGIVISSSSTPSTHRRVSWSADFTY